MSRFRRVEVAGRPEVQGTGLGLPLTKALVEANRATFAISSEARKSTRIDITFPTTPRTGKLILTTAVTVTCLRP